MSDFRELQERTAFALATGNEREARRAIEGMKDFVRRAEADLEKLLAWQQAATPKAKGESC